MVDILMLHEEILKLAKKNHANLPHLRQRISNLMFIKSQLTNASVHKNIDAEIRALDTEIFAINTLDFYVLTITPILDEYRRELKKPVYISFMGEEIKPDETQKKILTSQFLNIAKKYLPNVVESIQIDITYCSNCQKSTMEPISNNVCVCSICGLNQEITQSMFSYKDSDRINSTPKYTYDRRIHFRDTINQFQGKQHSTISPTVYEKLYEQIQLHNLENKGETREEKYKNVTKWHISNFLKIIDNAKHYEDLNLIYHNITGARLDDISHLEEVLIQDFDILNELYDQVFIKTKILARKNFLNTQYILYQLLKRHKYPCEKTNFNLMKTNELKAFHDSVCSELCQQLGWNFSPVF